MKTIYTRSLTVPISIHFDPEYPEELLQIYNPPVLHFYQGDLELLTRPKIAVVGARETTREGVRSVEKIIKELGNELVIVSGLAKGIDATAHYASIRNGGKTIGVIGQDWMSFILRAIKDCRRIWENTI